MALAAFAFYANAVGTTGESVDAGLSLVIERASAWGGWLYARGGAWLRVARIPLLIAGIVWLAWWLRRGRPVEASDGAHWIAAALGLGWIAESFLVDGRLGWGVGVYLVAAAIYGFRGAAPASRRETAPSGAEALAWVALIGLFGLVAIYRLDVFPELYVDEHAYLNAARMQLGEIDPGWILRPPFHELYSLERFRAQLVPLSLQTISVALFAPGILPLRVVSVVAMGFALLVALSALRRHLSGSAVLIGLALACFTPLLLAYSRAGTYISVSVLGGALVFAALLRVYERWNPASALVLGALLGGCLYFYQVSWFVPILTAAAVAAAPTVWRRPEFPRMALRTTAAAFAVALPGLLLLQQGFLDVGRQTFNRGIFRAAGTTRAPPLWLGVIASPRPEPDEVMQRFLSEAERQGIRLLPHTTVRNGRAFTITGSEAAVEPLLDRFEAEGWRLVDGREHGHDPASNLSQMLARLFYRPSWEAAGRLIDAPILNPVFAPLLIFGLIEALRRRREPVFAALLVWVVAGALLPATVGLAVPRRAVLILPFAPVLAALPLLELAGVARAAPVRRRGIRVAAAAALGVGVALTGLHLYFHRWDNRLAPWVPGVRVSREAMEAGGASGRILDDPAKLSLMKLIKSLPRDQRILVPRLTRDFPGFLRDVEEIAPAPRNRRILADLPIRPAHRLREISCQQPTPFIWIGLSASGRDDLFAALNRSFEYQSEVRGAYRLYFVAERKPGACRSDDDREQARGDEFEG